MHSFRPIRDGSLPAALPALLSATHLLGLAFGSAFGRLRESGTTAARLFERAEESALLLRMMRESAEILGACRGAMGIAAGVDALRPASRALRCLRARTRRPTFPPGRPSFRLLFEREPAVAAPRSPTGRHDPPRDGLVWSACDRGPRNSDCNPTPLARTFSFLASLLRPSPSPPLRFLDSRACSRGLCHRRRQLEPLGFPSSPRPLCRRSRRGIRARPQARLL